MWIILYLLLQFKQLFYNHIFLKLLIIPVTFIVPAVIVHIAWILRGKTNVPDVMLTKCIYNLKNCKISCNTDCIQWYSFGNLYIHQILLSKVVL